jgi:hypothetical protein
MKHLVVLLCLGMSLLASSVSGKETTGVGEVIAGFVKQWPKTWYPEGKDPETSEERDSRLEMLGEVVEAIASSNQTGFQEQDAAALIATLWGHESRFDYWVHMGGDSPIGHQDHGAARCLGQIQTWPNNQHLPTEAEHLALAGLDRKATERCARMTLTYFWGHAQRCLRNRRAADRRWLEPLADYEVAILMASYGAGTCAPVAGRHKDRARTYRALRKQL